MITPKELEVIKQRNQPQEEWLPYAQANIALGQSQADVILLINEYTMFSDNEHFYEQELARLQTENETLKQRIIQQNNLLRNGI